MDEKDILSRISALVDEEHGPAGDGGRRPAAAECALAARELRALPGGHGQDHVGGDAAMADHVVVEDERVAPGDGAHGELLGPGHAEAADDLHVERRPEHAGDLGADRHPPAREREHEEARR